MGTPITMTEKGLSVPSDPIVPFIEGDGIGPDIWAASVRVFDAAVEKAYGGERKIEWREVLAGQMACSNFPVPLEAMHGVESFEEFRAGESFNLRANSKVKIRTAALNHPNGATGYRIEYAGKVMCYVTDTEHVIGKPDQNVLGLIEGADLVIYDSTYTDKEFPSKVRWGHSTWQEGLRLCQAAEVKSLAIFHHDPDHDDLFMEAVEAEARAIWMGAQVAREHMRINLA